MKIYWLVFVFLYAPIVQSQALSEIELYRRCYTHITGQPVPVFSQEFSDVRNGKAKAIPLCEKILDESMLDSSGFVQNKNIVAKNVVNNFQRFHRTWFDNLSVEQVSGYSHELANGMRDIFDVTEPALEITRVLFTPQSKYQEILTSRHGAQAQRELDPKVRTLVGYKEGESEFASAGLIGNSAAFNRNVFGFRKIDSNGVFLPYKADGSTSDFVTLPKIQIGELIGVKPNAELTAQIPNVHLYPLQNDVGAGNLTPGLNYSFPLNIHFGGGIIGQPIFRMMFHGHGYGLKMDGAKKLPRRWSEAVMSTFLCAKLPALRESDIVNDLKPLSTTPFRTQKSCLMCHSNLDRMAYTARNQILVNSEYSAFPEGDAVNGKLSIFMTDFKASQPSVTGWPDEAVPDFHLQKPTGSLYFRSFTGQLVNTPVSDMHDLGVRMSETSDFYQCAAKRYFEYFTGLEVALYDRFDPRYSNLNKSLSQADIKNRAFVEKLGAELQEHQSLPKLIKSIINSRPYKERNFRNQE